MFRSLSLVNLNLVWRNTWIILELQCFYCLCVSVTIHCAMHNKSICDPNRCDRCCTVSFLSVCVCCFCRYNQFVHALKFVCSNQLYTAKNYVIIFSYHSHMRLFYLRIEDERASVKTNEWKKKRPLHPRNWVSENENAYSIWFWLQFSSPNPSLKSQFLARYHCIIENWFLAIFSLLVLAWYQIAGWQTKYFSKC